MPSEEPAGAVTEITNNGDDINKDFGGSFVWLVPGYTNEPQSACTNFRVAIQPDKDNMRQDLAKDAGGDFRYLLPIGDLGASNKTTGVRLLRSPTAVASPPAGYNGMTSDLNRDRKKDFLYLIYQTVAAPVATFVSGFDVIYGVLPSQEPRGAATEINGNGDDINKDFGGSYVWVVPSYNTDANKACTFIQTLIQSDPNAQYKDLAKGSGGQYRYLVPTVSPSVNVKISNLRLFGSATNVTSPPAGYDGITPNINQGRGDTFLYFVWKANTV